MIRSQLELGLEVCQHQCGWTNCKPNKVLSLYLVFSHHVKEVEATQHSEFGDLLVLPLLKSCKSKNREELLLLGLEVPGYYSQNRL
jgi:hypothetical protein